MTESQPIRPSAATTMESVGQILTQLFEEATELASLKIQKSAAKKDYDRKDGEFEKGKEHHEKFPAMEEAAKRNKELAWKSFSSIEAKCTKKNTKLQCILRQGASKIFLSELEGKDQQEQKLQSKVESLEKTTEQLQSQLQEHQLFIKTLTEQRRTELEASETEGRKLQNEVSTLRNILNEFTGEVKPRVDELQCNAAKSSNEMEALKKCMNETEADLADLSVKLTGDIETKISALSTRLVTTYDQEFKSMLNRNQEGSLSNATIKSLNEHGQRLQKLENEVRSSLSSHVSSIATDQRKFRENFNPVLSTIEAMLGRVAALEGQDPSTLSAEVRAEIKDLVARVDKQSATLHGLPSDVDLVDLRENVAYAQSATDNFNELRNEIDDLKKRADVTENQTRPRPDRHPSTPIEFPSTLVQLANIEKRLVEVEKQTRSDRTLPSASINEQHKKLILEGLDSLQTRLDDAEKQIQRLPGLETVLDAMEKRTQHSSINAPTIDVESLKIGLTTDLVAIVKQMQFDADGVVGGVIDGLGSEVQKIKNDMENLANIYTPRAHLTQFHVQLTDVSGKVASLERNEQSYGDVLRQIDSRYNQSATTQSNQLNTIDKNLSEHMDANTAAIENIRYRLDNMNTTDMAVHILNQMDSTYPNLRLAERILEQHKNSLQHLDLRLHGVGSSINSILARLPNGDVATTQALREEINGLTGQITDARQRAQEAQDAVRELKKDIDVSLPTSFSEIHNDLEDLKEWKAFEIKKASAQDAAVHKSKVSPAAVNRAISTSNDTPTNSIRGRSKVDSPASYQSSNEPFEGKVFASKRKRENGQLPPTPAKLYGVHKSPGRKRRQLYLDGRDDEEDVDFEPSPPTISDDD